MKPKLLASEKIKAAFDNSKRQDQQEAAVDACWTGVRKRSAADRWGELAKHQRPLDRLRIYMEHQRRIYALAIMTLFVSASGFGQRIDVMKVLAGVEKRYNSVTTLQVDFQQTYRTSGRPPQVESGLLSLRKPGKMRWDYRSPQGKLFVVDGKYAWLYSPATNRVEKLAMKETEDLRVPLAFLIGRLDFQKHFARFYARDEGGRTWIRAIPKSGNAPFETVEFVAGPSSMLERVVVTGLDHSVMEFSFGNEKRNIPLGTTLFEFAAPAGAEVLTQ